MLILTAFTVGFLAAGLRSALSYVLAGGLIVAAFALAALFSAGAVSPLALALALLAYNAGIAAPVFAAFILARSRQA